MTRRRSIRRRRRRSRDGGRGRARRSRRRRTAGRSDHVGQEAQAVRAAPLRVELDAEQPPAGDGAREPGRRASSRRARRPRCPAPAGRRTSGRSTGRRRRRCPRTRDGRAGGRPGSSRCGAASARRRGGPSARAGGRASRRRPRRCPRTASCRPRQMPRNGRSARTQARIGSTSPWASQAGHRRCGRADAGHDEQVGAGEAVRTGGDPRRRRRPPRAPGRCSRGCRPRSRRPRPAPERPGRRPAGAHPSVPFVDATPTRRGSTAVAWRSARPSALNAASARWWSLRPVPRTWRVAPALRANASRACSTSWSGSSPTRSPRNGRSMTA